ncbi:MAG: LysM peptidoglycan-binding domain-containing protein [Candidatus Daviesbacteria bacterium]|nr:LysM peptidoglycan-binding domain-containing protein [Candidatus Daviesbacteria bacterium]
MARPKKEVSQTENYLDKISEEVQSNQSRLSLILGGLIILVVVILIFNYFNRGDGSLGPSQETQGSEDVSPENLPGQYTVKEGDTLFTIAEKYYSDGYKYPEIVQENELANENQIEVGQVLQIPKLEGVTTAEVSPTPLPTPEPTTLPLTEQVPAGEKGASDASMIGEQWGPPITSDTYTVIPGDWLSKIAGRAYGDIFAYQKIADVNNIANPDLIEPGQVLKIPR